MTHDSLQFSTNFDIVWLPDSSLLLRSHAACSLEHSFAIRHVVCWKCTYWCPWGALGVKVMWTQSFHWDTDLYTLTRLMSGMSLTSWINFFFHKTCHIFSSKFAELSEFVRILSKFLSPERAFRTRAFDFCRFVVKPFAPLRRFREPLEVQDLLNLIQLPSRPSDYPGESRQYSCLMKTKPKGNVTCVPNVGCA